MEGRHQLRTPTQAVEEKREYNNLSCLFLPHESPRAKVVRMAGNVGERHEWIIPGSQLELSKGSRAVQITHTAKATALDPSL